MTVSITTGLPLDHLSRKGSCTGTGALTNIDSGEHSQCQALNGVLCKLIQQVPNLLQALELQSVQGIKNLQTAAVMETLAKTPVYQVRTEHGELGTSWGYPQKTAQLHYKKPFM